MEKEFGVVATPVLHLMKKSIRRTYILLVLFIALFVISIVDSIYQRCRIISILEELETVERVIETECNEDVET
jgi:sensor domain CHASE-containing protein